VKSNVRIIAVLLFCGIMHSFRLQFALGAIPGRQMNQQEKFIQGTDSKSSQAVFLDTVAELKSLLNQQALASNNSYYKLHCLSILEVINSKTFLSNYDTLLLKQLYNTFFNSDISWSASDLSSYLSRKRPFIVSWTSPTDGVVSLAWLILPENWDPEVKYPLYVRLHGLADIYTDPIDYMTYYLKPEPVVESSFEDGYVFLPWGRGNLWYEGIGETDIWEGLGVVENLVKVDPVRKYLIGFSMGGYGTWSIGQKTPDNWAAIGIYAGALWYDDYKLLNADIAGNLKDVPVYIVCGTDDGLLSANSTAFQLLEDAGNQNIYYTTFSGGHEALIENWQNMYYWIQNFTNDRITTDTRQPDQFISKTELIDNHPNPFNDVTFLHYTILKNETVELIIYNTIGQKVCTLVSSGEKAGEYDVSWNSCDDKGQPVPAGIYVCRLRTQEFMASHIMYLIK
jgi:hypothetical protein